MTKRRLDRLEDSLSPKEAVLHWLGEAHGFGSLPDYVGSLLEQPETAQPFVALPARVEQAVWGATRRERPGFIKEVMREAVGDTMFLLRLVIDLNVHIEETLRIESLRHASLYWWSRALDVTGSAKGGGRTDWERGVSTLRGVLLGTERARAAAEARYLDGHSLLFPDLEVAWHELCAAERLGEVEPGADESARAEQDVERVVAMARADGLEAAGRGAAADAIAARVMGDVAATVADDA